MAPRPSSRVAVARVNTPLPVSCHETGEQEFCNRGYSSTMAQFGGSGEWVFPTYALPRAPSAPRLALWRKLKRLGVAQLADDLVALPADARTREQLEWAADEAVSAGGSAGVWLARSTTRARERELARAMNAARAGEYQALIDQATAAISATRVERARAVRRLRAENHRIRRRDFFRPVEREQAHQALTALAASLHAVDGAEETRQDVVR